ncbi:zinc finger protein 646 [Hemicordylus capensis]|uniref:zinc finger protein 646 n=1 Tax=Hemicordylus capensis TaxID=884348 RepID=UPI0023027487|nr:zinc finger protein 646 [Hemicordylus capensis]XP_053117683.1 zinc finger protein 646 [Hemicordylus capensis]
MAEGDACEQSAGPEERPYKCKQCPRSYRHAGSLVNHRRTHEVGLFRCLLCQKDFSNPMALKSHLRTHTEEKRYKCQDCGRAFRASSQLSSHRCAAPASQEEEGSNGGGYAFPRGQDTSSSDAETCSGMESGGSGSLLTNLEKYIAESVVPADLSQQFPIKMEVEEEEALQAHQGEKEVGLGGALVDERRYKCNQCDKAYKHAGSLTNHKQSHTLGVYQCAMCFKEFSNLMALKSHARLHSEYRPYKCRFCHKAFRLPSELLSHQKAHDQEERETTVLPAWEASERGIWEEDSIETSAKLDIYQPPPMGTGLGDAVPCSLKDTSKVGGGERCNPDGELCVHCGGTFADEEELKGHSCLCPEEAEEEEEEEEEESSTPSQPAASFNGAWDASLKVEENNAAYEERPFRCGDCGRTYRHAGSLINHKKSHQIGVYSCSVCAKQLFNLAALKNHLRVHLKSKFGSPAPEEASQHPSVISDLCREEISPGEPGGCHVQPLDVWAGASCPKEEEDRGAGEEERPYRCEDCGRSYRHRGSLVNHRHTHQTGVFQCSICPKQYSNLMALRNHVRVHLRAVRMSGKEQGGGLTCSSCGESFEEEAEFQLHQLRHLPYTEDIEAAVVARLGGFHLQEADLLQAIRQDVEALENGAAVAEDVLPSSEAAHVCSQCGMTFASVAGLQHHTLQHSSQGGWPEGTTERTESPVLIQRLYGCDLCGKSYRHSGSLINHKQTHQTGDFSCSLCSKHFQNVASLKSHLRGHQKPRRAQLGTAVMASEGEDAESGTAVPEVMLLGEEFKDSYDVQDENGLVNGWESQSNTPSLSPGESEELPYLCEQCGLGFDQANSLLIHKQTHQLGIYQCSLCPKEYSSLLALKNHFHGHARAAASGQGSSSEEGSVEEQPFLCSLCGMIFPSEEDLQQHHSLSHEEGETQEGPGQDAAMKSEAEAQLAEAADQDEGQLLSHICGYCGQTFDDMASLEEHSEGHQEEKAAALADTSMQLRRAPRLEEDQPPPPPVEMPAGASEPLDSRPYACGQCGKTYRHGGSLVNHKKIHQIGDYQCGVCCRQYPNLSAYRNHLRNHPRCKLNGSVPEIRQPIPAERGGGLSSFAYEILKQEPLQGSATVAQEEKDPLDMSSVMAPGSEERLGQGEVLNASQSEGRKIQVREVCGEGYEEKAALEAHQGLHFVKEEEKAAKEEEVAGGEENGVPSAEEEGSPLERPFQCDVCGRSYKHAGSLINHKQTHKTGLFHCSVCQKQFYNLMALKNHNRTHFETKRYRCPECPKAFRLQKQLASHQRVHRDRKRDPSSHPLRKPAHPKRLGKTENSSHPLNATRHRLDPEERPYGCGECGRTYRHAGSLLNHQKSHKIGHFACPLCSKTYPNLMSLKNHQRIHYEVKRHRCLDCGKAFKWQRQLLRHQRRPHPCGRSPLGPECERDKAAPQKEQGSGHAEAPIGPFRCPLCPKQFPNHTALKNHSRVHAKKRFECSECGKAYRASKDLLRHLRRHQAEEVADVAEGSCSLPSSVAANEPLEEEERPYKCNSCERTYRHAGSLLNHKKAHATGLYHCPTCQKECYNLLALKNHLHIHTDKKRHRCPRCGKAFRTARRLATHSKGHGRPKEDGPFACTVCSKTFSHQLGFRQHQLLHAKDGGHPATGSVAAGEGS